MGQRLVRSIGLIALISTVLMFVVVWAVAAQRGEVIRRRVRFSRILRTCRQSDARAREWWQLHLPLSRPSEPLLS